MSDNSSQDSGRRKASISRRNFVKAAGVSGVAAGFAGCLGDGGDGGDGGADIPDEAPEGDVTIGWAADSRFKDNEDGINQTLHDAGMPDNITVEILAGSQVTDNRRQQYQQWLGGGRAEPTLLLMDSGWTIPFIVREQLQNLSQTFPEGVLDTVESEYFGSSVSTAQNRDGDLFGVPMFPDFPTMQYRKDWVEDAGYDPEGENWATESMDWKRFSEITADVKEQAGAEFGFSFQANAYEGLSCCDFNEFMTSWGGAYFGGRDNLFGPIGDRPITVEEEPVLNSIRMIRTFVHGQDDEHALEGYQDISPDAVLQWTEEPSRKPFTSGNVVMHRNWPYSIGINAAEDVFGDDLGVMPIPFGVEPSEAEYEGTGGPVSALGGWHVTMNPNAPQEKKQAALQLMKAVQTDTYQLWGFGQLGMLPPKSELFASQDARDVKPIGNYLDALQVAGDNSIPRPVTAIWPQQSERIANQVNRTYAQKASPEDAMSTLADQLQQTEESGSS